MNKHERLDLGLPARGRPRGNFCWQQNEFYDLFQPVVSATCSVVYAQLTRRAFESKFRCSARALAEKTCLSHAAVWRAFTVLECLGLLRVTGRGGNRASEITLVDLEALAKALGASRDRRTGEYAFSQRTRELLLEKATAIERRLQGKKNVSQGRQQTSTSLSSEGVPLISSIPSERDASGTPERQERLVRETQTGPHLFKENGRQENDLSPTPFHVGQLSKSKDFPDERRIELSLKRACDLFCGVMNEMKDHLVDPGRPQLGHLDDGYEDWRRFRFESLGVVEASEFYDSVRLVLCASDTAAAQLGLAKYRKTWNSSLVRWFGCEVDVQWQSLHDGPRGRGAKSLGLLKL